MSRHHPSLSVAAVVLSLVLLLSSQANPARGQEAPDALQGTDATDAALSTAFSYQGRLQRDGAPFNGTCDFQFSLWDAATAGSQKGNVLSLTTVAVAAGLFTASLDFGNQFPGEARWLETGVKCAGDAAFVTLQPRQPLTAVPYAIGLLPGTIVDNPSGNGFKGVAHTLGKAGVVGTNEGSGGYGVYGASADGGGVVGISINWVGVYGETKALASTGAAGVYGKAIGPSGMGVAGRATEPDSIGVKGSADASGGVGVWGESAANTGVFGLTKSASAFAVWGRNTAGGVAGRFDGVVQITGGADLAERFVVTGDAAEPGTLLVIDGDHPGQVKPSSGAYDTAVVGVVSGANGVQPGLTLHQDGVLEGDTQVAIAGRVYVMAEALSSPIRPGDLLTTSALPGHAMKATDRERAYGAVIGKALTGLDTGTGFVLVVVNLQ